MFLYHLSKIIAIAQTHITQVIYTTNTHNSII